MRKLDLRQLHGREIILETPGKADVISARVTRASRIALHVLADPGPPIVAKCTYRVTAGFDESRIAFQARCSIVTGDEALFHLASGIQETKEVPEPWIKTSLSGVLEYERLPIDIKVTHIARNGLGITGDYLLRERSGVTISIDALFGQVELMGVVKHCHLIVGTGTYVSWITLTQMERLARARWLRLLHGNDPVLPEEAA